MEAKNKKYNNIIGQVIDLKNKKGITNLKIEAWDKDRIFDGSLGSEVTDKNGHFQFEFTEEYLTKIFGDKRPDIYFKIFDAKKLLKSTEHDFSVNIQKGEQEIVITLDYYALVNDISINVDFFRIKTGETENIDEKTRKYIGAKLNAHLTEHITNRFANPSEELKSAIGSLNLKYEDIKDESIKTVINKHVLPALKKKPTLKEELKDIDTERVGGDTTTIKDLLHLDQSIKDNPILGKETRRTKTLELANIAKIDSATAGRLADKDIVLEYAGDVVWANLVKEGVINEAQLKDFQLTFELAKLAGDNFKFIKKLKTDALTSIKDFIARDKEDWLDVLRTSEVETPEGETLEEYADNIVFNIEHAYPSQFFMQRIAVKDKQEKLRLVGNIQPLFKNNKTVFGNGAIKRINWEGIDPADRKTIEEGLTELKGLANTYKYLGVVDILNDSDIDAAEKQQAITREIDKLKTFYQNNPDIDLRFVSFFEKRSSSGNNGRANLIWDNISEEDQPKVRKQLMSYQRAMNLAMGYDASEALLAKGFDSAFAITNITKSEFTKDSGLTDYMAEIAYENANRSSMNTTLDWSMVNDVIGGCFDDMAVGNNSPDLVNELRDIDGYDDLFGVHDYCETEHCRSIFSPAAYFVDLMLFIETYVSNPVFVNRDMEDHPIYLKNRRSDLWELPLTCENTNNMIPYLEIINEILERYLNLLSDISDIYNTLRESRSSFNQPFNLPLEGLRIYMRHFDLTLYDIYKLLFVEGTEWQEIAIARERLKLSIEEFNMVINADSGDVLSFYGDTSIEELRNVPEFLKCTCITREELDQLIELDFIDNDDEIKITREEGDDIQNYKEIIENLSEDNLGRIHRFIRLWRKLPWTLQELDLVLKHLQEAALADTLDQDAVIHIADLVKIQDALKVSVEELCALFHNMDIPLNEDLPSLFDRLFDSDIMFGFGHSSIPFHHPSFNDRLTEGDLPDANTPHLLAGLGITETDLLHLLEFLRDEMQIDVHGNPTLNHRTLSVLYRHAKLAKALKLSIEDFLHAVALNPESSNTAISTIEDVKQLITFTEWLKTTPFSVGELWFILRGEESSRATYTIASEQIAALVQKIQEDKALIFSDCMLSEIDGVSEDDSKSLIEQLKTDGFIAATVDVENQYNLSASYRLDHDFGGAFDAIDASEELRLKEDEIRGLLNGYHHKTVLSSYLIDLFNVTQEFLDAVSLFIETDLADNRFITALNTAITDGVADTPDDLAILAAFVKEMERLQLLFEKSKLDEGSLQFITDNSSDIFDISDIQHLTLKDIGFINIYRSLLVLQKDSETVVDQLLTSYRASIDSAAEEVFTYEEVTELAKLIGCDSSLVQSLLDSSLELPVNALKAIEHLIACLDVCNTLGISGPSLKQLASTESGNYDDLTAARDTVLGAFKAKYDDEQQRQDLIVPFENEINTKKRDALCDYILSRNELKFEDMNDLYSFFLIDVEMSGVVKVSKVKAGISSLQLYIHRCLMNREQSQTDDELNIRIEIEEDEWEQFEKEWEWRKNYRVWEANRKVFLYPENWIEPELRDNKTPIFKELEDELLQQKITKESAENAYKKYITQFAEVAKLKIAGSYYHQDLDTLELDPLNGTLYLFGRTLVDPPQYYYRKYIDNTVWTPWEKIELGIDAPHVSAIIHHGKLYLFWVEVITREMSSVGGGDLERKGYKHEINLQYSYLNESGKWIAPQRLERIIGDCIDSFVYEKGTFESSKTYKKSYPVIINSCINFAYLRRYRKDGEDGSIFYNKVDRQIDLYNNRIIYWAGAYKPLPQDVPIVSLFSSSFPIPSASALVSLNPHHYGPPDCEAELDGRYIKFSRIKLSDALENTNITFMTDPFLKDIYKPAITIVHNKFGDSIVQLAEQQFWIRSTGYYQLGGRFGCFVTKSKPSSKRELIRLTTSLPDDLGNILYDEGLDAFLSLATQEENKEKELDIDFITPSELLPPLDNPDHIDFRGAYGIYYRELFFHIPFLIATHLNANQKFEEAKYWYEKIFNPTASEKPEPEKPTDRNWRYIEFRNLDIKKLKEILTDDEAILLYKTDPFSPHAIARLRLNAYQKAIVMKYIDNLLDWGDHLFAQDTYESINEATMLYIMAADILGKRPVKLGKCELAEDVQRTYPQIRRGIDDGSEFLITLENWVGTIYQDVFHDNLMVATGLEMSLMEKRGVELLNYKTAEMLRKKMSAAVITGMPSLIDPGISTAKQSVLVFGIPANDTLLDYWDRVEDRLFKIRNGMNIKGVRRELALFQPPIDPGLLVKAKAAGLSLEDILASLSEALPPYRFPYLIEKAKSVAGTVQSFGSALLSALEKKEVEELTLLRSVHEQNILKLTKAIRESQIEEATAQLENLKAAKVNVENRLEHYDSLIETGLIEYEQIQQISRHIGTGLRCAEGVLRTSAATSYLVPQLGSLFALKFGGKELGDSLSSFASGFGSLAIVADSVAASAGLEATFQRREEEWKHQLTLVNQELLQMDQQIIAAEIRLAIPEKDLEIHKKNVEQTKEVYDFFKDKFTDLGLYDYLAVSLNRLYREAYTLAYDMAKLAERAYRFERDDDTLYIETDNWQADRAGLLAGERLLLQLQQMEKSFIEKNVRDYEINQSFSMRQIDPGALIQLREAGMCDFSIPEIVFDLFYPGQYKRKIKSVRMTIPCVTGPYTNVSCKLTLLNSEIRKEPDTASDLLIPVPYQENTSVATSNANNDGGVFELNFRDERYMPFEGAGAISTWKLELPGVFRHFDYNSISDVIFHISYTAKDDGLFKKTVETNLQKTLIEYASGHNLIRLFSMKHEFSNELHRFLYPLTEEADQEITMTIDRKNFPYFLHDKTISVLRVELILKLKPGCDEFSGQIAIARGTDAPSEGEDIVPYSEDPDFAEDFADLYTTVTFDDIPDDEISDGDQWTLKAFDLLDPDVVEDIGLLFYYTIKSDTV